MGEAKRRAKGKATASEFEKMVLEGVAGWTINDIREQPNGFLTGGLTMWSRLIEYPALRQHVLDIITVVRERLNALELLQELAQELGVAEGEDEEMSSAELVKMVMGDDEELPVTEVSRRLREKGFVRVAEVVEADFPELFGKAEARA